MGNVASITRQEYSSQQGVDLIEVRADIARVMYDRDHDDGSYAPLLIRFSWHCCGTYDKVSNTGGSNGGTMRFPAEQADLENAWVR